MTETTILQPKNPSHITMPYQFIPYYWQIPSFNMLRDGYKRGIWVDHRRCGKDIRGFNLILEQMWLYPGLYYYVFPSQKQGRKILWEGYTDEGDTFFQTYLPKGILSTKLNKTDMKFSIYCKGNAGQSMFQIIGTDMGRYESMRGTNPRGVIFSEQARQHPGAWDVVRPILMKNGGWALFQSTPNGDNHFKQLYENAQKNPRWFTCLHTVDDTYTDKNVRMVTHQQIEDEIAMGMGEDFAQQEFWCSFKQGIEGTYVGKLMQDAEDQGRIEYLPYDPTYLVSTYWDLGVRDFMSVWFVQQVGQEIRFIDYEERSGTAFPYWARLLQEKGYLYKQHYAPFDIQNNEMVGKEEAAKSRLAHAKDVGILFKMTPMASFQNGVDVLRGLLGLCRWDEEKCKVGIDHLKKWGKHWNKQEERYIDIEKDSPHTHAGAAARYAAINIRQAQGFDVTKTREETTFRKYYRRNSGGSAMSV